MDTIQKPRLIPIGSVEELTGFKKSSIYKWIQEGSFPPPVKIGRSSRWASDEIDAWIDSMRCSSANSSNVEPRQQCDEDTGDAGR